MTELFREKLFLDLIQDLLNSSSVHRKATYHSVYNREVAVTLYSEPGILSEHNIMIYYKHDHIYINKNQLNIFKFNLKLEEALK